MAEANAGTAGRLARMGMPLINPSQGLAALASVLSQLEHSSCISQLAALPLDANALLTHGNVPAITQPLLADLVEVTDASRSEVMSVQPELPQAAAEARAPSQMSQEQALEAISRAVESILGFPVPLTQPLMAAGLDSLASVELTNALQTRLGLQLPPTLVFDYPTVQAMAAFVCQQAPTQAATAAAVALLPAVASPQMHTLVTDMVTIEPGSCLNTLSPTDAVGQVPVDR